VILLVIARQPAFVRLTVDLQDKSGPDPAVIMD